MEDTPINQTAAVSNMLKRSIQASASVNAERTTEIEYREGIYLKVRYISKPRLRQLNDRCTTLQYNERTRNREPMSDTNKLLRMIVEEAIIGWRGVTPASVSKVAPHVVDLKEFNGHENMEMEYDIDVLIVLMDQAYGLDEFVMDAATNPSYYRGFSSTKEATEKN
jgi:hypothetical protein